MTSVGPVLKENESDITVVAVEPAESTVLSGGTPGPHRTQALGAGFVLDVLDTEIYDTVCRADLPEARRLARTEGFLTGLSGGAALHSAATITHHPRHKGALIMVVLPAPGSVASARTCSTTDSRHHGAPEYTGKP
ncbi:hypothetical protein ACN6K9_006554 [Streptomyces sp. SAS_267]|uniref:hypothetical protein n=1 Tax=unclassified Streptomyces TaxID=2593676 RepID=UPI003703482A